MAITPDGKTAYVVSYYSHTVAPIDIETNTAGEAIAVGAAPQDIAIAPDGTTAYVALGGSVRPIDLARTS